MMRPLAFLGDSRNPDLWPAARNRLLPGYCVVVLIGALLFGCAGPQIAPFEPPAPVFALEPARDGILAEFAERFVASHEASESGYRLLDSNEDGLRWRLVLIDSAKYSIDAQYYLWYGDAAGRILAKHLIDAADRGVRVRLLVDDLNTMLVDAATVALRDDIAARLDSHPNIELRLFNPWSYRKLGGRIRESLGDVSRVNQRMHNKSLIVDNRAVVIGGRNLGDEYMGLNAEFNFRDLDVLGIGPVAPSTSAIFDDFWNSEWVAPASMLNVQVSPDERMQLYVELDRAIRQTTSLQEFPPDPRDWTKEVADLEGQLQPGTAEVYSDRPVSPDIEHVMLERIDALIDEAQQELLIENAYIIPSDRGITRLRRLHDKGVGIRILTNSLASHDVPAVNSHYKKWRKPIIGAGAELYELRHDPAIQEAVSDSDPVSARFAGLHSKAMVVDRRKIYIGSMNYDPRSALINTEMGVFIDSPGLGEQLAQLIERDMQPSNSWQVTLDAAGKLVWSNDVDEVRRQPARSWWQRVEDVFFMAFPKEMY